MRSVNDFSARTHAAEKNYLSYGTSRLAVEKAKKVSIGLRAQAQGFIFPPLPQTLASVKGSSCPAPVVTF